MFKKILFITALLFSFINISFSQYPWAQTNIPPAGRYEDVFFLNKDTGFAASNDGYIYKTINGGQVWDSVFHSLQYIRSIEFSSSKRGFAGSLLSSANAIFMKTLDGGNTWINISNQITISNKGICGICCVDTNVTYASGAFSSPAYVIKTTDGGLSWAQIDMSAYAKRLVDIKFIDQNVGYVIGQSNIAAEGGVILKTTDGGLSWNKVFTTNNANDYIWKIQNLDNVNWFCSIQKGNMNPLNEIIKSTDGGNTWVKKTVSITSNHLQMVGFITKNKGWAGYTDVFETNDGGNTWQQLPVVPNSFNRFFPIDSTLAYISGNHIYKYEGLINSAKENHLSEYKFLDISVNPNPHTNPLKITVKALQRTAYSLSIFDSGGERVVYNIDGILEAGENKIAVDENLKTGVYYAWIIVNEGIATKKFIIE